MDAEAVNNWMSVRSAAAHLECSERQIYRLISSGQLAAYKAGRLTRIRRCDLDRAILAQPRNTPTTATQLRLLDADSV